MKSLVVKSCSFQVSWIRKSDLHVLTSDGLTFTGDQRFSAHFEKPHDDIGGTGDVDVGLWTLQGGAKFNAAVTFTTWCHS